jgi:hypothetical protein
MQGDTLTAPMTAEPSNLEMLWDVFISHTGVDKEWVKELATRLEAEPLEDSPTSRTIKVFLDIWDIQAGENIVTKLNEGLSKARFVAVVMSPEFFKSNWTAFEWTHWVMQDPNNTRGRIIPILYRQVSLDGNEAISLPAPFRAMRFLDFSAKNNVKPAYVELLRRIRGLPGLRGERLSPTPGTFQTVVPTDVPQERWKADEVQELLVSNLFPVANCPSRIWSAATELRKPQEVYDKVSTGDGVIIHSGKLYTFAALSDELCPLRGVIDVGSVSDTDNRDTWLADPEKGRLYTWLLNAYLRQHLGEIGLLQDDKERFFFPPRPNDQPVVLQNREVTAKKTNQQLSQTFWVHSAADIRFYRIWGQFFLKMTPCFFFTSDGKTPLDGKQMGRMAIKWGGRQRNPNILRDLVFWATLLRGNKPEISIPAGAERIVVQPLPATARASRGIRDDHIRFARLMKLGEANLAEVASDIEVSHPDDDEETTPAE